MIAALIVVLFYLLSCLYQVIYQCIAVLGFQNPQDLHILRFLSSFFFFFSFPLLHMYLFGLKVMFQASSDILTVFHFCIKCRQTLQVLSGLYWSDNCVRLKAKKKKTEKQPSSVLFVCFVWKHGTEVASYAGVKSGQFIKRFGMDVTMAVNDALRRAIREIIWSN